MNIPPGLICRWMHAMVAVKTLCRECGTEFHPGANLVRYCLQCTVKHESVRA